MHRRDILVVEDDAVTAALVRMELEPLGHRLSVATDLDGALDRLKLWTPDVVVAGASLPTLWDTLALCRMVRARRRLKHARLVVLTRSSQTAVTTHLRAFGADDVLTKPIDTYRLARSVLLPRGADATVPAGLAAFAEPCELADRLLARLSEFQVS